MTDEHVYSDRTQHEVQITHSHVTQSRTATLTGKNFSGNLWGANWLLIATNDLLSTYLITTNCSPPSLSDDLVDRANEEWIHLFPQNICTWCDQNALL